MCRFVGTFAPQKTYLDLLTPLLQEKNTWVRRVAEETWEQCGYRTWGGKVIGPSVVIFGDNGLRSYVPELLKLSPKTDFADNFSAAVAALSIGDTETLARLLPVLSDDSSRMPLIELVASKSSDANTRRVAVQALAANGSKAALEAVLDLLKQSSDQNLSNAIVEAWPRIRNIEALDLLTTAVSDGTDLHLGGACSKAIAHLPTSEPSEVLLNLYREADGDDTLLDNIAHGIAEIEAPEAVSVLAGRLNPWPDDQQARAILTGLLSIGTNSSIDALFELLKSKALLPEQEVLLNEGICKAVEFYADRKEIIEAVRSKLKSDVSKVRIVAAQSLSTLKADAAVERDLDAAVRSEKNADAATLMNAALQRFRGTQATAPGEKPGGAEKDF